MLIFARTTWILFTAQLRHVWFSKRALMCALLAAGPCALAVFVRLVAKKEGAPPEMFILLLGWMSLVQCTIPMIALIVGSAAVAEEVEDRTITYLLTRPIPRGAILVGRWLAGLVLVLCLALASGFIAFTVAEDVGIVEDGIPPLPEDILQRFLTVAALASVTYTAVFAALGTFFKHPVIVGLAYTSVIEVFLANLPGGNQALTIQYYLKSYLLAETPELATAYQEHFDFLNLAPPSDALQTLAVIVVIAILGGVWRLSRRQFLLAS
jgi:ABC-type transport system involved in multi-copper enzyme maturation permease subunit